MNVFVAADLDPSQLPKGTCPHIFLFPDYQGIDQEDRVNEDFYTRSPVEISVPCLNDPGLAPPGKTGIIISALARTDFASHWGTDQGRQTPQYESLKERVADQLIATAERVFPDLRRRLIFRQVSTPYTLQRLTMNTGGSICGWTYDRRATFRRKADDSIRKSVATPVVNLLQAGHWTVYPGGAPVCVMSGRLAADHIVRKARRGRKTLERPENHDVGDNGRG